MTNIILAAAIAATTATETIKLPAPDRDSGVTVTQALKVRHSERAFSEKDIPLETLSGILWAANGFNRPDKRTNATALNKQTITVYTIMKSGAYLYDAKANTLVKVCGEDLRGAIAAQQSYAEKAPVSLLITADLSDSTYKPPRDTLTHYDAGIVSANIYLSCAANGLATVCRGSMDRAALKKALKLPETTILHLNHPIGYPPEEKVACPVSANVRGHEDTEWSISYGFHLTDKNRNRPRVLLVGDSICNGYQSGVARALAGKMNVTYWVSSYCVTSPGYLKRLELCLDEAKYDVVHFNNGLHSLGTPTEDWAKGLEAALKLIRARQPSARIVWTTSTPLKDAQKTAKVRELNAAGAEVVKRLGDIATDDLFALLDPLDRNQNWTDTYHHKAPVRKREAEQVAAACAAALKK